MVGMHLEGRIVYELLESLFEVYWERKSRWVTVVETVHDVPSAGNKNRVGHC